MNTFLGSQTLKLGLPKLEFIQMRFAKSPGQSQKGNKKQFIQYSIHNPGEHVDEKTVIGKQKRLEHHPGLNVGVNPRDKSLFAIRSGTVYYSYEKFVPNRNNQFLNNYYKESLAPKYVKYIHVIPDKPENQFRMIDII